MKRLLFVLFPCALAFSLAGCHEDTPGQAGGMPILSVKVASPVEQQVIDYNTFTGRTAAVETIMVRARVTGYLDKINFKDGDLVKVGQILCEIDARPYKAAYDQAVANRKQSEAHRDRLTRDYERARVLFRSQAVSQEDYDKYNGDLLEAQAACNSAQAAEAAARLNLDFTKVRSAVTGRISRRLVDRGNLIKADDTVLTNIVTLDPIYAYFDVDDMTFMQVSQRLRGGQTGSLSMLLPPVALGVIGEKGYPHKGTIDFLDNQVDSGTGTLRMRGVFPNKDGALVPGLFARLQVPLGEPHKAILIPDRAVDTDQGRKVLWIVDKNDVVEKRPVQLGRLHTELGALREIISGAKPGDRVVVDGLQRVRPRMKVKVEEAGKQESGIRSQESEKKLKADG